ncbi:MAG: molybdopterin molybdotransferase MoeA [Lagierella massiliensis]|nr:molybdopterin molybdotransferase MoeA [Lagierella massiliensis]
MITVNKAINKLKEYMHECNEIEIVPFDKAVGYVLAEDVVSNINVPDFPKSAMDGYAFNHKDITENKTFSVIGENAAGNFNDYEYKSNSCVRVMTGGYVPTGYDCVIKQEDIQILGNFVKVLKPVEKFFNYCQVGEDIKKGQIILNKGEVINHNHVGILASLGLEQIKVYRPLKVSIVATGSELLKPGEELIKGKIYCSSLYIIKSILENYKIEVVSNKIITDDIDSIKQTIIEESKKADIILTTGGVSVGKFDHMPKIFEELEADILFRKVSMKPGTPVTAGYFNNKIILSMSGNPFATMVNFQVLFWPMVEKYYNSAFFKHEIFIKIVKDSGLKPSKITRFIRAKAQDEYVKLESLHKSSVISNLSDCNCLVIQEPNKKIEEGDQVKIIYLF